MKLGFETRDSSLDFNLRRLLLSSPKLSASKVHSFFVSFLQSPNMSDMNRTSHPPLLDASKEELIQRINELNFHVKQLRNIIEKRERIHSKDGSTNQELLAAKAAQTGNSRKMRIKKPPRDFQFNRWRRRHIALKFLYLGWNYQGYVVQEDTPETIENYLFEALSKTKLIQSRETSNYHRCGRTDKGVSAFSQIISLDVRCNAKDGLGVFEPEDFQEDTVRSTSPELNYCQILNKVLPASIRCIAWSPVRRDFSARFDCKQRTYKYFFPVGGLNLVKMREACESVKGEHDFRNLCKMDVNNGVVNYRRKVISAEIMVTETVDNPYSMGILTIVGQAFLWHQIRCIVAILFLVGEEKESPEIISSLLNVEANPNKPQYSMASELPLVLYSCEYDCCDVTGWVNDSESSTELIRHLQGLWCEHSVKEHIIRSMLSDLEKSTNSNVTAQNTLLTMGVKSAVYTPLLKRPVCESLAEKIRKARNKPSFVKKLKRCNDD